MVEGFYDLLYVIETFSTIIFRVSLIILITKFINRRNNNEKR